MVGFLSIFSFTALATVFPDAGDWDLTSLASKWPYSVMFILNMILPFVTVFLATGLMKKNKKLDTNEVFLTRPISNADFVLGRVMALLKPLFLIHIIILVALIVANMVSEDASFNPVVYLYYPLIMSVPSLVFVTGLSFMVVSIIRNQAVSLVVILAILGTILIQFSTKYNFLLDFNATAIPLLISDMIGIEQLETVLYQRGIFFFLGIGFLAFAILLLDRLPMKKLGRLSSLSIGVLSLTAAVGLGYSYYNEVVLIPESTREIARAINDKMYDVDNATITSCDLKVEHGADLKITAQLVSKNDGDTPLDNYYFFLNPDLQIAQISRNGSKVEYNRELHKISIPLSSPLPSGGQDSLSITYAGGIDESISYLDVDKGRKASPFYEEMFSIPKRHAFVTPDYLLLTSEVIWHPQSYPASTPSVPGYQRRSFVNYSLEVTTRNDLMPISQGEMTKKGENSYLFSPDQPLSQVSLVIGKYENRSVSVDSTDYNFTTYNDHDYFLKYYDHVEDTIPEVIRILRKKTESRIGLKYPFKRFTLVEVPITFHAYFTLSQNHQAFSQPEMVFMPEMGGDIFFADLRRFFRNIDRWRFEGQKVTDKKRQAHAAHDYLLQFLKSDYSVNSGRDAPEEPQFYSIVPNMLWFTFDVHSKEWPLLAKNLNDHLCPISANSNWWSAAQTLPEQCNNAMRGKSMEEALATEKDFTIRSQMVKSTGKTLMARLQEQLGDVSINDFIKDLIERKPFQSIDLTELKTQLETQHDLDFENIITATYANKDQPFYSFDNLDGYALSDGGNQRYQVKFDVTNLSEVSGVVEVEIRDQVDDKILEREIITLEPKQTKRWAKVTNQRPRLSVNTLISQNIPQRIRLSKAEFELKKNKTPEDGITVIANNNYDHNEIIVDNEDSGFSTISEDTPPLLQQWAFANQNKSEFKNIYRAPRGRWSKTSNNNYFGKHIRSAHFVRTGNDLKKAVWSAEIKTSGYYDVYAYSSVGEVWWNDQNKETEVNHYIVYHADGQDEVAFDKRKEKGWVYLGSYYLNEGITKVELTNESEHRLVFADAVKWTRNDIISNK